MKSIFENKFKREKSQGEENTTMADEINNVENEQLVEEQELQSEDNVEEVASNNEEIEKLKAEKENLNNQYLRLAADFDNYRKRQAQEREALLKYGAQECMKKLIEVVDNFDRAMQSVEKIDDVEKMKETFFVLNKQLTDNLAKLGLEQIKSVGEKFDPNLHEAVMQTQTDEYPEETIIKELQKGYKMGDKVLRPSMVDVAVK
jgi:molecular chaperone GrpE